MRTTMFELQEDTVHPRTLERPDWQPFKEWEGQRLSGVELVELLAMPQGTLQLVRISAGGHFVMHTTPDVAHCQIVSGRGTLRLPDGRDVHYEGPELYVFMPHTLHEWCDVTEDTLLSVCLVHDPTP